jgi:hypothetical protein
LIQKLEQRKYKYIIYLNNHSDNNSKQNRLAWEKEANIFEKNERKTLTELAEKVNKYQNNKILMN